jgi:hypothetical protein
MSRFALLCILALPCACHADNATTTTTTTKRRVYTTPGENQINNTFLNPGGSATCPSKCRYYFAGAAKTDSVVCQKQGSGVGLAEQNMKLGVACYPSYGCGRDMITCVNQEWTKPIPSGSAAEACAGLAGLTAENPWTCGTAEEGRPACKHNVPNNNVGKWLKATAGLDCGWGSTYGNVRPGYDGTPLPASSFFEGITSDYDCCLKAMEFEGTSWAKGGAALFFQQGKNAYGQAGDHCRVDRESIVYANMDSSSGRSVKYQNTRCGTAHFFYRQAAGAADAANLHTGGKCVLTGGFKKAPLTSGTNLPKGELPEGHELPNHDCPSDKPDHEGCGATLKFNTINDAEECCRMCSELSWLAPNTPNKGGDAARDPKTGLHVNPCVAWQIVDGRCRITRKAYFDHWSPTYTVLQAITDSDFSSPGNTGWVIPTRGCGDSMERCNYYSSIYYRQVGTPQAAPEKNATFRKILKLEKEVEKDVEADIDLSVPINFTFSASSVPTRRDTRKELVSKDGVTTRAGENAGAVGAPMGGSDCGQLEVFDSAQVLTKAGDYDVFDEEKVAVPLCVSLCISSGTTTLSCTANQLKSGRRLAKSSDLVLSFTGVGSGYDQVNFQAGVNMPAAASVTPITAAPTTKAPSTAAPTAASTTAAPVALQAELKGAVTMTVPDPSAFLKDMPAQNAVKEGIAAAYSTAAHNISASSVKLDVKLARRRLGVSGRRLAAGAVRIVYTIALPADSSVRAAVKKLAEESTAAQLTTHIQTAVSAVKGSSYKITVTSKEKPTMESAAASPTTTAASAPSAGSSESTSEARSWLMPTVALVLAATISTP